MLSQPDLAKLLLRFTLGILILLHGLDKLIHGVGGIETTLSHYGLPAFLAWGVFVGEIIAPLMVILGVRTRIGAVLIAINMVVAIFLVHRNELLALNDTGGWAIELQGMFLATAIAVALLGPGRWRLHS